MERSATTRQVRKYFYTKKSNKTQAMSSLQACIDYYK